MTAEIKKRGRPKTGAALTNSQKQAAYRSRKDQINLSVMISTHEKDILDKLVKNGNTTLSDVISTMIRLAAYEIKINDIIDKTT